MIEDLHKLHMEECERWIKDGKTESQLFDIGPESVVLDIGAWKGLWSLRVSERYNHPKIHAFEPVKRYYSEALTNLKDHKNVVLHNFGLGAYSREGDITVDNDASSLYSDGLYKEIVFIKNIKEVLDKLGVEQFDATEVNVEGAEYELLEYIFETGIFSMFKQLMIQFHVMNGQFVSSKDRIREKLLKHFTPVFLYEYVWEFWVRKDFYVRYHN